MTESQIQTWTTLNPASPSRRTSSAQQDSG